MKSVRKKDDLNQTHSETEFERAEEGFRVKSLPGRR